MFKRHGTYQMTYSANHYVEPIHGIHYATAQFPLGPWKKAADNPLVSQKPEIGVSVRVTALCTTEPRCCACEGAGLFGTQKGLAFTGAATGRQFTGRRQSLMQPSQERDG